METLFNIDNSKPLSAKKMKREENKLKAFKLHNQGFSFQEIADKLQCAKSTAWQLVKDAQADAQELQIINLNVLKLTRLSAIDLLIKSRFQDLDNCTDIEGDDGRLYRDGLKTRGFVVRDILTLLQEKSKLEGLYDNNKVDSFVTTDSLDDTIDYTGLSDDQLAEAFADLMRQSSG